MPKIVSLVLKSQVLIPDPDLILDRLALSMSARNIIFNQPGLFWSTPMR